jgi:hypothetical protein
VSELEAALCGTAAAVAAVAALAWHRRRRRIALARRWLQAVCRGDMPTARALEHVAALDGYSVRDVVVDEPETVTSENQKQR